MTTSPNPNHAEEARRLLELPIAITEEQVAAHVLAAAQVHATLALEAQTARLADAQEAANLILVAAHLDSVGEPSDEFWDAATEAFRLDLTQDVTPVAHTGNDEYDDQLERLGLS